MKLLKRSASAEEDLLCATVCQKRQSVGLLRRALTEIQESFGASFGGLIHCDLHHLTAVPSTVQLLWQSWTTSLPSLYNSSQCWTAGAPSTRELFLDALSRIGSKTQSASEEDFRINYQGEVNESIDPKIVLAQLIDPDPCSPAFLTGLRLPSVESCGFRCPYGLCEVLEPEEECNIQINMTPKYSFVDLHIGRFHGQLVSTSS
jgi:hypothetical protein